MKVTFKVLSQNGQQLHGFYTNSLIAKEKSSIAPQDTSSAMLGKIISNDFPLHLFTRDASKYSSYQHITATLDESIEALKTLRNIFGYNRKSTRSCSIIISNHTPYELHCNSTSHKSTQGQYETEPANVIPPFSHAFLLHTRKNPAGISASSLTYTLKEEGNSKGISFGWSVPRLQSSKVYALIQDLESSPDKEDNASKRLSTSPEPTSSGIYYARASIDNECNGTALFSIGYSPLHQSIRDLLRTGLDLCQEGDLLGALKTFKSVACPNPEGWSQITFKTSEAEFQHIKVLQLAARQLITHVQMALAHYYYNNPDHIDGSLLKTLSTNMGNMLDYRVPYSLALFAFKQGQIDQAEFIHLVRYALQEMSKYHVTSPEMKGIFMAKFVDKALEQGLIDTSMKYQLDSNAQILVNENNPNELFRNADHRDLNERIKRNEQNIYDLATDIQELKISIDRRRQMMLGLSALTIPLTIFSPFVTRIIEQGVILVAPTSENLSQSIRDQYHASSLEDRRKEKSNIPSLDQLMTISDEAMGNLIDDTLTNSPSTMDLLSESIELFFDPDKQVNSWAKNQRSIKPFAKSSSAAISSSHPQSTKQSPQTVEPSSASRFEEHSSNNDVSKRSNASALDKERQANSNTLSQRELHLGRLIKNIISVLHDPSIDSLYTIAESTETIQSEFPSATIVLKILESHSYTKEELFEGYKSELKKKHL